MKRYNCEFVKADGVKCLKPIKEAGYCELHTGGKKSARKEQEKPKFRIRLEEQQRTKVITAILESLELIGYSKTINAIADGIKNCSARFLSKVNGIPEEDE